jgi:hypothetical protein
VALKKPFGALNNAYYGPTMVLGRSLIFPKLSGWIALCVLRRHLNDGLHESENGVFHALPALMRPPYLRNADNVRNFIAELIARVRVKYIHHATVLQGQPTRAANFY